MTRQCRRCGAWFTPFANPSENARAHCGLLTPDGPECYPCLDEAAPRVPTLQEGFTYCLWCAEQVVWTVNNYAVHVGSGHIPCVPRLVAERNQGRRNVATLPLLITEEP